MSAAVLSLAVLGIGVCTTTAVSADQLLADQTFNVPSNQSVALKFIVYLSSARVAITTTSGLPSILMNESTCSSAMSGGSGDSSGILARWSGGEYDVRLSAGTYCAGVGNTTGSTIPVEIRISGGP